MSVAYRRQPIRNDVLLAMLTVPLYVAGVGRYGQRLILAAAVAVAVGLATEAVAGRLRRKPVHTYGFLYWLLLPLVLPPVFPLWMVAVSVLFATLIAVAFFGGHGRQIAAPVAVAWAFAMLSFQGDFGFSWSLPFPDIATGFGHWVASVLTVDHPIEYLAERGPMPIGSILRGDFPQTPGNAVPWVTLACAAAAIALRAVDVRGVVAFLAAGIGCFLAAGRWMPETAPPIESLLVGNFVIGAVLVFGDVRTAGRTFAGRWASGLLAGAAAFAIRTFSGFADGVFFAVLLGNVFSPILDEGVLWFRYRGVSE